jgi:hypothetical protein
MRTHEYLRFIPIGAMTLAIISLPACGGDDDDDNTPKNGKDASTASGGTTGNGTGGSAGTSGAGGFGFRLPDGGFTIPEGGLTASCSEPAPTDPVTAGGATCSVTTTVTQCIYPCVAKKAGQDVCGAKQAAADDPVKCQPYPPEADSRCIDHTNSVDGGATTTYKGCCNAENQCGIISQNRNLCVTVSQSVKDMPATPKACDAT